MYHTGLTTVCQQVFGIIQKFKINMISLEFHYIKLFQCMGYAMIVDR